MYIVTKEDSSNDSGFTSTCEDGYSCDPSSMYEEITKVDVMVNTLNVKKHALESSLALFNRVDDDREYVNMYAASEAMVYARLADVADDIAVGAEGFFNVVYKVIAAIFKSIIALISKIMKFISNIFKAIFGFLNHDDVTTPKGREEKLEIVKDKFKDTIDEFVKLKSEGYKVSDIYTKSQEATIEASVAKVLEMVNKNLPLRAYSDGIGADNTVSMTSVITAYRKYINGINSVSNLLANKKFVDILSIGILEFNHTGKGGKVTKTNVSDIVTNIMRALKGYELNNPSLGDDHAFPTTSTEIASLHTLAEAVTEKIDSIPNNQFVKMYAYINISTTEDLREDVIKELFIGDDKINTALIAITPKKAYVLSTTEKDASILEKIPSELIEASKKLKTDVNNNDVTMLDVLSELASIVKLIADNTTVKLEVMTIDNIEALNDVKATGVNTDDLDFIDSTFTMKGSNLIADAYRLYSRELDLTNTLKKAKNTMEALEYGFKAEEKKLKALEKDIKNILKEGTNKTTLGNSVNSLVGSVNFVSTAYAHNVKSLTTLVGDATISYNNSKFADICSEILKVYRNRLVNIHL